MAGEAQPEPWYWSDPLKGITGVVMIQRMRDGADSTVAEDFETLVYQALDDSGAGCWRARPEGRR